MGYSNHGAAYDLSIYEKKEYVRKQPELRVVDNPSPRTMANRSLMTRVLLTAVLVVSVIGVIIYSNAILTEIGDEINSQNKEYAVLLSESKRLSAELESKVSLRNIEDTAKNDMGLARMESYQIEYVNLSEGDKIELTAASPKQGLADKIKIKIGSFLEYLPSK